MEGKTPNPEALETILMSQKSSKVFYLSVSMLEKLKLTALKLNYSIDTPCWVVEKATWPSQRIIKGTLFDIENKVNAAGITKTALILFGEFLNQQEKEESHLYSKKG